MSQSIEEFNRKYHISLNPQQQAAQAKIDGSFLILAVPGSGKTTVLVDRLGYMVLAGGVDSASVLTVTYTRAAAGEMQKRFADKFDDGALHYSESINFCTINSFAHQVLRFYGEQIGKKQFDIVSDEDVHSIIRDIFLRNEKTYPTESDFKDITTAIAYAKNMMLTADDIEARRTVYRTFPEMYAEYNEALRSRKLMDFDDQLVYAYKLLAGNGALLNYYKEKYKYVCVDEAQDTSLIQHRLIRLLVGETGNLFMVGDEDQSIYGFRAACPEELYGFKKTYPKAEILIIETNYRSGSAIVSLADGFIKKSKKRHPKSMNPDREESGDIMELSFQSRRAVAEMVCDIASREPEDTAVLYRNNESALPIVNLLDRKGIPYRIKGNDTTFFSNPVIRDINAILRLALNGRDVEAFLQIYYKVGAYVTKQEAQAAAAAYFTDNDFFAHMALSAKAKGGKIKRLWFVSYRLRKMAKGDAAAAIRIIREELNYDKYMSEKKLDAKKADMYEILASQCGSITDFLGRMNELEKLIAEGRKADEGIILSTIHLSKGLEYDTVYLLDALQDIFPTRSNDYEEERRLFYVAVTRAKNHLRFLSVQSEEDSPSEFVKEALTLAPVTRLKMRG